MSNIRKNLFYLYPVRARNNDHTRRNFSRKNWQQTFGVISPLVYHRYRHKFHTSILIISVHNSVEEKHFLPITSAVYTTTNKLSFVSSSQISYFDHIQACHIKNCKQRFMTYYVSLFLLRIISSWTKSIIFVHCFLPCIYVAILTTGN